MNIKKNIWWFIVLALFVISMVFLLMSHGGEQTEFERLADLSNSIYNNPEQWENIEIGGESPQMFIKHLYVIKGVAILFAHSSVYLLLVLLALIAITYIFKNIKKKSN